MSTLVLAPTTPEVCEVLDPLASKPLDEAAWKKWLARGRAQDKRDGAFLVGAVTCVSIAVLFTAAALWPNLTPYDVAVRFLVCGGAIALMVHQFHQRRGLVAAVFGVLALVYNPVMPAFPLAGGWQRAIVLASAAPFLASLVWHQVRQAQHE